MKERLTADDVRNIEEGAHLVVELHEDEYWQMGEGKVNSVKRRTRGATDVYLTSNSGHRCKLHIPADARGGLEFDGAARGARNLRVERVYQKT